jgi:glycosyltransferase involved in cell wall biosynthesis
MTSNPSRSPHAPGRPAPTRTDKVRVLLLHTRYRQRGGEDAVFDGEVSLLRARGHDVHTFVVDNRSIPEAPSAAERLRLGLETVWSSRAARAVARRLDDVRPDVVHAHNTFPLLSPSVLRVARARGAAVVQTIHNYRPICPAATLFRDGEPCSDCVGRLVPLPAIAHACYQDSRLRTIPVAGLAMAQRVGRMWRNVDAIIALTGFAADQLVAGGLPGDRIHIKPNFVDPDPGPRDGAGEGFVFVGRLAHEKGVATVLRAVELSEADLTVTVIGDGPERSRIGAAAAADARIRMRGQSSQDAVRHEMRRARALVFPSLWYEGMPMTILEAFASGVPVIAARRGAAAELVLDGRTGLTFEPGDAAGLAARLRWAQDHPSELAELGRGARAAFLATHTAAANYDRLMTIYAAAIDRRSAGRAA